MPESKKKAPLSWYIVDVIIGIAAALYIQYAGTNTGRAQLSTYGVVGLVGAIILGVGSSVTKVRGMLPLAMGALAFGALALYLAR